MSEFTGFTATKAGMELHISKELLKDSEISRDQWDLLLGLREPTAKEVASGKRFAAKQARLRAAGLINDRGWPKKVDECPAVTTLGNYDSTDEAQCERKVGHRGPHRFAVEWDAK